MTKQARKKEVPTATAAQQQAFLRLLSGEDAARLSGVARTADGLLDLRGVSVPNVTLTDANLQVPGVQVQRAQGVCVLSGVRWKGLDFSGAQLPSLRFFDAVIEQCRFEAANCEDWRLWGTQISETSFRGASLRSATFGVDGDKRNIITGVDFSAADLRSTGHTSSDMVDCVFVNTKLKKVEFNGTCFARCRFEGLLEETRFSKHQFKREHLPANLMDHVDFRKATLKWVDFRELDLDTVLWPENSEHFIISDFRNTAVRAIAALSARQDLLARQVSGAFEDRLKWAGKNQKQAIVNRDELMEMGGEEAVALFKSVTALH